MKGLLHLESCAMTPQIDAAEVAHGRLLVVVSRWESASIQNNLTLLVSGLCFGSWEACVLNELLGRLFVTVPLSNLATS